MKKNKFVTIIAAVGPNGEIGYNNQLIYNLKSDMKHFKDITTGYTVIMGRKTFESLPKGALPNRTNIVVTNMKLYNAPNAIVANSIEDAIEKALTNKVFIIGGGQIYKQSLSLADAMILSEIPKAFDKADTFFPEFNKMCVDFPYISSKVVLDKDAGIIYKISTYMKHLVG